MSGTGSTSFPYSKGSILPDTPTTATQTHPLSGTNVIGGKKSKRRCLENKIKGGDDEKSSSGEVDENPPLPTGGKKSKKNKRKARRSRKTKKSWLFF